MDNFETIVRNDLKISKKVENILPLYLNFIFTNRVSRKIQKNNFPYHCYRTVMFSVYN